MTVSFSELRAKEVIRICDAESIGCVSDLLFDCGGRLCALCVVPTGGWGALFSSARTVIAWEKVRCIGSDTILVDVGAEECGCSSDGGGKRCHRFRRRGS